MQDEIRAVLKIWSIFLPYILLVKSTRRIYYVSNNWIIEYLAFIEKNLQSILKI